MAAPRHSLCRRDRTKSRCNMDNSFDERCETDISDCFEDILEGEEEVFYFFI